MKNKKQPTKPPEAIKQEIDKIINPIINKVLQEIKKNPMSVGGSVNKKIEYCLYKPHNYRIYIDFDKSNLKTDLKGVGINKFEIRNKKELVLNNFYGCNIIIKKTQIEIRNFIEAGKTYRINITTGTEKRLIEIDLNKVTEAKDILRKFIKLHGGKSNYTLLNIWHENKIWHEKAINKIPLEARWHTKISKKVYKEKNVEFSDTLNACNYIDTRAIENIAPEIANSINYMNLNMTQNLNKFSNEALNPLTEQIKLHLKVQRKTGKNLDEMSKTLKVIRDNSKKQNIIKRVAKWLMSKITTAK